MKKETKSEKCERCKGQGVIEKYQPELGFETLVVCPVCEGEKDSLLFRESMMEDLRNE